MSLEHALPGQPIDVRPFAHGLPAARTTALFKSRDIEVMRLVLLAGKSMPPHKVAGEVAIQCLEGALDIAVEGRSQVLRAGHLLYLAGDAPHAITAIEDASALVTIALKKP